MFNKISIQYRQHGNPDHTLNEIKPRLHAMQVLLDLENNDHWTHAQRSKFNFVIQELLTSVSQSIRESEIRKQDDIGDIPF